MKQVLFFFLITAAATCKLAAQAAVVAPKATAPDRWLYTETVTYKEEHDPSDVYLADGRDFYVIGAYEASQHWPAGLHLTLAYSVKEGYVVIDPKTEKHLSVISGWGSHHPLDVLLEKGLEAEDTASMVGAYEDSDVLWKKEIQRLYQLFADYPFIPKRCKTELIAERAAWEKFEEQHGKAASSLFSLPDGTKWFVTSAEHYNTLLREHASRLQELVEVLDVLNGELYSSKIQSLKDSAARH